MRRKVKDSLRLPTARALPQYRTGIPAPRAPVQLVARHLALRLRYAVPVGVGAPVLTHVDTVLVVGVVHVDLLQPLRQVVVTLGTASDARLRAGFKFVVSPHECAPFFRAVGVVAEKNLPCEVQLGSRDRVAHVLHELHRRCHLPPGGL